MIAVLPSSTLYILNALHQIFDGMISYMQLSVYAEIGILIGIATAMAFLMRLLRQPLIVGHIITGFLVGRFVLQLFQNQETLQFFSELGISFLLFSVGLTLNPKVLKNYGLVSVVTGFGQVFLTGGAGILLCLLIGYDLITALYVGIALSFSSTVIVMKLLSDKGDLDKLYVKVSIGSLLLQDFIAIVLLFTIPFVTTSQGDAVKLFETLALGIITAAGVFLFARYFVRHLHAFMIRSQELLFLFTIAWGMGISALFAWVGFSLEGGALIAGIALSTLPSRHEIGARLAPLRDFFIVIFFILLGMTMVVSDFRAILIPAIILSLFVLFINPIMQLIVMGFMGFRKKTSFQTGTMAAQISEFSLILVALGVTLGQVPSVVLSVVTLVGIITIFISSYLILYSDFVYKYIANYLDIFERKNAREKRIPNQFDKTVLIGGSRVAYDFINLFIEEGEKFLVIEHDPDVIRKLEDSAINVAYGDASDPDLLDDLRVNQAELVVSTVPDINTNFVVLSCAKKKGKKGPIVIVVANQIDEALELYSAGADYVVLPHFLGGSFAASLVQKFTKEALELQDVRQQHINQLQNRESHRYDHIWRNQ